MILASAPGAHFEELGTKTNFRQRFLIMILLYLRIGKLMENTMQKHADTG